MKFYSSSNKMRRKYVYCSMIHAPSNMSEQAQRAIECRQAIEPPAMLMLDGSRAPFFDFTSLLHAILPAATAVGWEEHEVQAALETIVADRRPRKQ